MGLTDIVNSAMGKLPNFNVIDLVLPLPETKDQLAQYVKNRTLKQIGQWNPEYDSKLQKIVADVHKEYEGYLNSGANSVDKLANMAGLYADANLAVGNILGSAPFKMGSAGLKIINHVYQALKGVVGYGYFAENPKDYVYLPWLLLTDALSVVPFGTALSPTFSIMVRNRMATEVEKRFMKEIDIYKSPVNALQDHYKTKVLDRSDRFISPDTPVYALSKAPYEQQKKAA